MMVKYKLVLLFILFSYAAAFPQTVTIQGRVTSQNSGLPGAAVAIKGTGNGTITDIDGFYTLEAEPGATLVFSYIGYKSQEEKVNGRTVIQVELTEDTQQLDEVIISVPYGTAKKSTFTGSAGYISESTIANSQVSDISKALQGTVPGIQTFSSTGQPGSSATVLIRGVGSANASSTPLYVIDGIPFEGDLNSIANSDIANITILKDAASAALYGSRAANGVVMISTKQGQNNSRPSLELTAKYGWSSRARSDYKKVSSEQWLELFWESLRNYRQDQGDTPEAAAAWASKNLVSRIGINPFGTAYAEPIGTDGKIVDGASLLWDDNWDDALQQNAHYADVNVRVSGGSEKSRYYLSLGYLDDQGAYIGSNFSRYTLRTNIESDIRPWLQVGLNLAGSYSDQDNPPQTSVQLASVVFAARVMPGWMPIYQHDPATGELLVDEYGNAQYDYGSYRMNNYKGYNLVATTSHDRYNYKTESASVRGHVRLTPFKGFSYRFSVNTDYKNQNYLMYRNPSIGKYAASGGSLTKTNSRNTGITLNNVINYEHQFSRSHNLRLMVGQEYYEYNTSYTSGSKTGILTDGYYEPDMASTLTGWSGNSDQYKLLSYFSNGNYDFEQRYFLSASFRTDGSSRFSPSQRWGTFWSVGASWKITNEKFMQSSEKWLNNLSLRLSYGAQGNDQVGYYAYQGLFDISNNLGNSGLIASQLATPDLTWETNYNFNIGLDFGLWDNRLQGTVEYFIRRSKNLLFDLELVPSSGYSSSNQNIGAVKNYGWEFSLSGYPIHTHNWKWKLGFNATTYKSRITSLPASEMWSGNRKWVKGGSLYDLYVIGWAGVNPENGNGQWWYTNAQGERCKTESYATANSNANKVYAGSSLPNISGGVQTELSWKEFSFSALMSFSIGGHLINNDFSHLMQQGGHWYQWSTKILDRWTPENRDTDVPRMNYSPQKAYNSVDSRFLQSLSYARLKTVTLSYSLPRKWLRKADIGQLQLFTQAENLFTLCGTQGLNPEQAYDGTSNFRYPAMKVLSLGINLKY